jgi:hypothetical protein
VTLVGFLLARIDDDQREAAQAAPGRSGAASIARWHRARVLAECDAKRRIIELQRNDLRDDPQDWEADEVLRLLALPYADHPDYRAEWRP